MGRVKGKKIYISSEEKHKQPNASPVIFQQLS